MKDENSLYACRSTCRFSLTPQSKLLSGSSVSEIINNFLAAKARTGRSDRCLRALKNSLSSFAKGRTELACFRVASTSDLLDVQTFDQAGEVVLIHCHHVGSAGLFHRNSMEQIVHSSTLHPQAGGTRKSEL